MGCGLSAGAAYMLVSTNDVQYPKFWLLEGNKSNKEH